MTIPTTAQAQIGRYTVESRMDLDDYVTWYVKVPSPIPGLSPHVEAIAIDRARAVKIAGALAAVDAIKKLLPDLNALASDMHADPDFHEYMTALAEALRFMNTGGAAR